MPVSRVLVVSTREAERSHGPWQFGLALVGSIVRVPQAFPVPRLFGESLQLLHRAVASSCWLVLVEEAKNLIGSDSDPVVTDQLGIAEGEIRLLEKLDEIRMRKAALAAENPEKVWNASDIRRAYQDAFSQAGYDFVVSDRKNAISMISDKLSASPIKDELITALDDWGWGIKEDYADVMWETTACVTGKKWRSELRFASLSASEALWLSSEVPIEQLSRGQSQSPG